MTPNVPTYTPEQFSRLGKDVYDRVVAPAVRAEDVNKFVAIDIVSSAYEMDRDDYTATERLLQRQPDAQIWLARVGQPTAYRIGNFPAPENNE